MGSSIQSGNQPGDRTEDNNDWTVLVRVGTNEWRVRTAEKTPRPSFTPEDYSSGFSEDKQPRRRELGTSLSHKVESLTDLLISLIDGSVSVKGKRLLQGLQVGAIVGLILGCLSLLWFHQTEPITTSPTPTNVAAPAIASSNAIMRVPAVQVYSIEVASYSRKATALQTAKAVQQHGIENFVAKLNGTYTVLSGIAIDTTNLGATMAKLQKLGLHPRVKLLQSSVVAVPTITGSKEADMKALSNWLTLVTSSLNTITGTVSGMEPSRDATVAFEAANKLALSERIFAESGYSNELLKLKSTWVDAFQAMQSGKKTQAEEDALESYLDIMSLRGEG